ncbi:MAG: tRNA lysidine(34) synthetase TilS [Candidatus Sulfotelmatobacter sp.]
MFPVPSLLQRLLEHIRRDELLSAGDRVGVAVSGGIDSVALLRLLLELRPQLGIVLSVVHFNHKLRGAESDADEEFVAGLAREYGLEFYVDSGDTAQLAAEEHSGLEAAARELRYGFFRALLGVDEGAEIETGIPQGLKPESSVELNGTAEAVPFPNSTHGAAEAVPFQSRTAQDAEGTPFRGQDRQSVLNKIVTGHTLDDQAETVLMRVIRGTGSRGLGGIHPRVLVVDEEGEERGEIVRPLLEICRRELEKYLRDLKQPWREDATNADSKFTRNRVRKLLLPLLEREFNSSIVENLSELAEIARDEEDYWDNEISGWLGTVVQWSAPEWLQGLPGPEDSPALVQIQGLNTDGRESGEAQLAERIEHASHAIANASLSRPWLLSEPKAVQRRIIKAIGAQAGILLEFKHVQEILRFAAEDGPGGKELALPGGWKAVREPEAMVFVTPDLSHEGPVRDYEYALPVPGRVLVPEFGVVIEALRIAPDLQDAEYNPQQLLDAKLLPASLILRNWRPGDRFWPAHTKSPKKIKELLQEKHIPQAQRRLWPVVASGEEIVWVRGFPVPAIFGWKSAGQAVLVREVPWDEEDSI